MSAITDVCSAIGALGSCVATYLAFMATRKQAAIAELQFRKESARDASEMLGAAFDVYHAISKEKPGAEKLRDAYLRFVLATRKARILYKEQPEIVSALNDFRKEVDFVYHGNGMLISPNISIDESHRRKVKAEIELRWLGMDKYIYKLEDALVNFVDIEIDPEWRAVEDTIFPSSARQKGE